MKFNDKNTVRDYRERKQENQELCGLFLEFILLFSGEGDDTNKLAFQSREVSPDDANRNSVGLSEVLEFIHFLFHVDLNDCCSLEDISAFIEFNCEIGVLVLNVSFFDDRYRLTCKCTFIDECWALENDGFEGEFDGVFEENYVSWDDIDRGDLHDRITSEDIDRNVVVSHVEDFLIELSDLV